VVGAFPGARREVGEVSFVEVPPSGYEVSEAVSGELVREKNGGKRRGTLSFQMRDRENYSVSGLRWPSNLGRR